MHKVINLTHEQISKLLAAAWKVPFFLDGEPTFTYHSCKLAAQDFAIANRIDVSLIQPPIGVDQ